MPNVRCTNADCPEDGVVKDASGYPPELIHCGECGQPVEATDDPLTSLTEQERP